MESSSAKKVCITGVTGYLGSWVLKSFLEADEKFNIRATVRDPTNKKKIQPLRDAIGAKFDEVELVAVDLTDSSSLDKAIEGCDYVVHTASPFPDSKPKDPETLLKPAVEGTKAVCESCRRHKVERLVVTSSVVSILDYVKNNTGDVLTEEDWLTNFDRNDPYPQSKAMAEKSVWDYLDSIPKEERFDAVILNPGFILGPILVNSTSASLSIVSKMLQGKFPGVPNIFTPMTDIRDIAEAHVKAITMKPESGRYIIVDDTYELAYIGEVLHKEFRKHGYKPNKKKLKYCIAKMASCCSAEIRPVLKQWNKNVKVDNSKSKSQLGMKYRDMEKTIVEMGYSLIDYKLVKDRRK